MNYTEADVFYDEILVDFLMTKNTEQSQLVSSKISQRRKQTYTLLPKRPLL
jgi:hypothetical protein